MRVRVAGVTFAPGYPNNLTDLQPRCEQGPVPVELVREVDNAYDPNAVAVKLEGRMLGHLPRDVAEWAGPTMDRGVPLTAEALYVAVDMDHRNRPGLEIEISG